MEKIYKVTARVGGIWAQNSKSVSIVGTVFQVAKVTEKSIMASAIVDGEPTNHNQRFPLDRLNKVRRKEWGDGFEFFTDDPEKIKEMVLAGLWDVHKKIKDELEKVAERSEEAQKALDLVGKEGVKIKWQD